MLELAAREQVVSCDADGVVKLWDARKVAEIGTIEAGQHPLNSVCLDRSATRLAAASNDGSVKVRNISYQRMSQESNVRERPVP